MNKFERLSEYTKLASDDFECSICFESCMFSTHLVCEHEFCDNCLSKWKKKSLRCPLCRHYICPSSYALDRKTKQIHLDNTNNKFAGITVKKENEKIIIKKINSEDEFYKHGIRKGDQIKRINGETISEHEQCIDIIEQFSKNSKEFQIEIIPKFSFIKRLGLNESSIFNTVRFKLANHLKQRIP